MIWQDIVFMIGGFLFVWALWPSVFGKDKPDTKTSIRTGVVLTAFVTCYATLGLWLAAASTTLTALMWYILFFQKRWSK